MYFVANLFYLAYWYMLQYFSPFYCWMIFHFNAKECSNYHTTIALISVQFSSVTQSCPILCNPMDCSTPVFPAHHQLPEFTQTHVHCVGDAIQPSHPLSSPSPPTFDLYQHQFLKKFWLKSAKNSAFQIDSADINLYDPQGFMFVLFCFCFCFLLSIGNWNLKWFLPL